MKKLEKKLPAAPGIYIFRGSKRAILYIGKATSLHSRVSSYFRRDLMSTRGPIIVGMVEGATSIETIITDSVLEALILEAHLIKKHQPPYNTKEKDNKSFNFVVITKETFPRVITMRGRELETKHGEIKYAFGPFPQGSVLREALTLVRKIFPFRDKCTPNQGKPCFNAQIGLCPAVCAGKLTPAEYAQTITRIKLFFEGKKKTLVRSLERDMTRSAKALKFEEAARLKRTIFALTHIQDIALLKHNLEQKITSEKTMRIEAYDVAHISGTNTVGVMVVLEDGEPNKNAYRKFKIRTSTNDDNASLHEILERRFGHPEWLLPSLIVVDGGKAQVATAERALKEWGNVIPVVGVVKDEHHRAREILGDAKIRVAHERAILLANSEAHRFAIAYHRTLRRKPLKL
ncbi:MAG: GIY-YIG nuclease family protein [Patescibacteria group bacterium]